MADVGLDGIGRTVGETLSFSIAVWYICSCTGNVNSLDQMTSNSLLVWTIRLLGTAGRRAVVSLTGLYRIVIFLMLFIYLFKAKLPKGHFHCNLQ